MVKQGYKQTEIGVIPEDWEVKAFKDVTRLITCGIAATPNYVNESLGKTFLSSTNVKKGKIDFENVKYIPLQLHNQLYKNNPPEKGDILYTRVGAVIGEAAVVNVDYEFSIYVSLTLIKEKKAILNNYYLMHLLNSIKYENLAYNTVLLGGGVGNLNVNVVREFPIILPPLAEQEAIATALSDADAWIERLEQLIAKKRLIKQGAMQELLTPPSTSSGNADGEALEPWEVKKLGEVGKTFGGLSGKTKADFGKGNACYIPFMNVMKNVVIDNSFFEKVNLKQGEVQNKVLKNDLLFNGSSETPEELGISSVLLDDIGDLYLNSFCFGFRLFDDSIPPLFLSYLFRSPYGRKIIFYLAQGATRYNLSKANFMELEIAIPKSLSEQTRIATILSDMDTELEALEKQLSKARQIKQGMMQELLTGRIRL